MNLKCDFDVEKCFLLEILWKLGHKTFKNQRKNIKIIDKNSADAVEIHLFKVSWSTDMNVVLFCLETLTLFMFKCLSNYIYSYNLYISLQKQTSKISLSVFNSGVNCIQLFIRISKLLDVFVVYVEMDLLLCFSASALSSSVTAHGWIFPLPNIV